VPRLVRAGHDVVAVSRGERAPYHDDPAWTEVERLSLDRDASEADGTFGATVAGLGADMVVDCICFTEDSAQHLVDAIRGRVSLLVHVGTIWVHGAPSEVPVREDDPRHPFGDYGIAKAAIERMLHDETRNGGLAATIVHPGHISGPGWPIINPLGNLDLGVWTALAAGERLVMPNFGLESVHHVHADDVAQLIQRAIENPTAAAGESFHAVSDRALTLRGFAEAVAGWYGRTADLEFVPFAEFALTTTPEHAGATREHISRNSVMSIEKARTTLGYEPAYSSLDAVAEAVGWLRRDGQLPHVPVIRRSS
jgi:nucleoside-diphosphate-sugar epimerase